MAKMSDRILSRQRIYYVAGKCVENLHSSVNIAIKYSIRPLDFPTFSHCLYIQRPIAMLSKKTATSCRALASKRTAAHISKVISGLQNQSAFVGVRPAFVIVPQQPWATSRRGLHSTPSPQIKEFFPENETAMVKHPKPAWEHPV